MGLSPKEMENAIIKNLLEKTGRTIGEWQSVLEKENLTDKQEMNVWLKERHKIGHFQAQTIVKFYIEQQA